MAGLFFRRLFTGTLPARNPIARFVLVVLGLAGVVPLLLAILEAARGNLLPFAAWVYIGIAFLFGILLLLNLVRNLLR